MHHQPQAPGSHHERDGGAPRAETAAESRVGNGEGGDESGEGRVGDARVAGPQVPEPEQRHHERGDGPLGEQERRHALMVRAGRAGRSMNRAAVTIGARLTHAGVVQPLGRRPLPAVLAGLKRREARFARALDQRRERREERVLR